MTPAKTLADPFDDYVSYLRDSHTLVEQVYRLEKQQGFVSAGSPESRQFVAARLAAGASELRDMIATAWQRSEKPAPEYHPAAPKPPSTTPLP
jgi:hypothetical protein